MKTAILYARFSTDKQTEASIADQFRVCEDYAERHGINVRDRFSDQGISGAAFGNRPGVQAALAALQPGEVLLINDLSRLSRSQDLAPTLSRLTHRGIKVIGVQDGFDSDSLTARLQAGMSGIMSEEFRSMIARRTHSALEFRAKGKRPTGGNAYGFDSANQPKESEIAVVREMFERFAGGESLKAIAASLNERSIKSPGANWKPRANPRGMWRVSTVRSVLMNDRYIGRVVWNRSKWIKDPDTGKRKRVERPESEWIVNECPPVVDQSIWDRAQARFKTMSAPTRAQKYLLSGLLVCGVCGSKLVIAGGVGSNRRYRCGQNHTGGEAACSNSHSFKQQTAEEMLLEPVIKDLLSEEAIKAGVMAMKRERAKPIPTTVNRELVELERLVASGVLSPEVAAPAIDAAKQKNQLVVTSAAFGTPAPTPERWRDAVRRIRELLTHQADVEAARDALQQVIGEVSCTPEGAYTRAEWDLNMTGLLAAQQTALREVNGRIFCGSGGALPEFPPGHFPGPKGLTDRGSPALAQTGQKPGSPVSGPLRSRVAHSTSAFI